MARLLQTVCALSDCLNNPSSPALALEASPVGESSKHAEAGVSYRPIPGFPGYRVGDDGSVWSCWKRIGTIGKRGTESIMIEAWHLMSQGFLNGYRTVALKYPPRQKRRLVHQLILEAFVGPCPKGMQARHFPDRDRTNNCLANLGWGTRKQNGQDRITHGTSGIGEKNGRHRVSEQEVLTIRQLFVDGLKNAPELALDYGVSKWTIKAIVWGRTWKHLLVVHPIARGHQPELFF